MERLLVVIAEITANDWSNVFSGLILVILPLLGKKGISVAREITDNMSNRIVDRLESIEHRLDAQDEKIAEIKGSVNGVSDQISESLDNG